MDEAEDKKCGVTITHDIRAGGDVVFTPGYGNPPGSVIFRLTDECGFWVIENWAGNGLRFARNTKPSRWVRFWTWLLLGWRWLDR